MAEAVSIGQVYAELKEIERVMVTKEDLEALADTFEIMNHPETMLRIQESERAIQEGKVKEVHSVQEMLDEIDE